jgi:hypothetical protein
MEQSVFSVPVVNPATKSKFCPQANRERFQNETKCVLEFPPAVSDGSLWKKKTIS